MDCEFFRKLEEIIDGNPDPRVLDELRADPEWRQHLDQCETCRRVMDDVWKPLAHLGTVTPPEPSQALKHRIAGQIEPNSRVFSALRPAIATAVVCIVFLAGYWVRDIRDPDVFPFESPRLLTGSGEDPSDPACFNEIVWPMNPSAMYQALPDRIDPHPVMLTGISPVNLPSHLTVHGPYSLNPTHIQVLNSGACIPFVSPFGDAVMLHVTRVDSISRDTRYVVRADPERVLFYTITWEQNGWRYRIAGRFPANYLLDLAREITVSA